MVWRGLCFIDERQHSKDFHWMKRKSRKQVVQQGLLVAHIDLSYWFVVTFILNVFIGEHFYPHDSPCS